MANLPPPPPISSEPNWKNRTLFHGDNLKFLRAMNSESVDLIATDPPFKKGKDFHATPDSLAAGAKFQDRWSWERDVEGDWIDTIEDDFPAVWEVIDAANAIYMRQTKKNLRKPRKKVGSDMGAFLCFMAVRLLEMHRILKSTGSIYLHCDPTASHYLKAIMDAIFGKNNFVNEIVWSYESGGRSTTFFPKKHDILFWYSKKPSKQKQYIFNTSAIGIPRGKCVLCGVVLEKWNNLKKHIDKDGRVFRTIKSAGKTYVYYDDEPVLPTDVWLGINHLQQKDPERYGYPTQKPLQLYERIILASTNKGDMVLDPFCGCATTAVASERLSRQWVGIDIWKNAHEAIIARLEKERLIAPDGDQRRAGLFPVGQIYYEENTPTRTDDGEKAAPFLQVKEKIKEPAGLRMSRKEMYEFLLAQRGQKCQGCDREFDDPRYLELDHNTPRSDGGLNHISNRILLCGPCNKLKSNTYTLSGLRRQNKKLGYMRN